MNVNDLINYERKKKGISSHVFWSREMARLAQSQANYCAKVGHLVHSDRYAYRGGENLAQGPSNFTSRAIVDCWLNSKAGHREYLLSPKVRKAGVGIAKSGGKTFVAWAFSDDPPTYPDCPNYKLPKPKGSNPKKISASLKTKFHMNSKLNKNKFLSKGKQRYLKKLILNLTVLATEIGLIWVAYNTFTHTYTPLVGALSLIGFIALLWFLINLSKRRGLRYQRPGMIKTAIAVIFLLAIFAFAGVQPVASYKDQAIGKITNYINEQEIKAEEDAAQKRIEEEERLSKLGITNPKELVEELANNKELRIGLEVIELVNVIRRERGTGELVWDDKLYEYSLAHSRDMAREKRLFHTDMYLPYAENAWGGEGSSSWGAETIVESWMNSRMHRTWLLCPNLKNVAVGVASSSNGMYASWTFWKNETIDSDWWYQYSPNNPPAWWY